MMSECPLCSVPTTHRAGAAAALVHSFNRHGDPLIVRSLIGYFFNRYVVPKAATSAKCLCITSSGSGLKVRLPDDLESLRDPSAVESGTLESFSDGAVGSIDGSFVEGLLGGPAQERLSSAAGDVRGSAATGKKGGAYERVMIPSHLFLNSLAEYRLLHSLVILMSKLRVRR